MTGLRLVLRGQVQGVGFRPTVWRLAQQMQLSGDVRNTPEGVSIRLWGAGVEEFADRLRAALPALARIDSLRAEPLDGAAPEGFTILASDAGGEMRGSVTPDAVTCADCLAETLDPGGRRYRYPFTNCTNCGPRFSIVTAAPYDRAKTTMAPFALCGPCAAEYGNPADRRFHAQPVACADCGPRAWVEPLGPHVLLPAGSDAADTTAGLILGGHIVAIRGLGGVHLACDATDPAVVAKLRRRKGRPAKALALMARDLDQIRTFAEVSPEEAEALTGSAGPIVLLRARPDALPQALAPGLDRIGVMLPCTPLHHLILARVGRPVVMTSGNRSGQPQCTGNAETRQRLAGIADAACLHDREIANRIDDSVVRVDLGRVRVLRRARGLAPAAIPLPPGFASDLQVLAMGGEVKNTFCLVKAGQAILSQHMGDLEDAATHDDAARNLALYSGLFDHAPDVIAVDRHPQYLSTQTGYGLAGPRPVIEVQHHHAHVASCLAENGRALAAAPVLGIAMDGTGLGDDGTIWGGEFLVCDYRGYSRAGCLKPVALPGGAAAVREPWRNAYAQLVTGMGWDRLARIAGDVAVVRRLSDAPRATLDAMIAQGRNAPLSSSCGRLFDVAAAMAGLAWGSQSYEGEAAMRFEAALDPAALGDPGCTGYAFDLVQPDGAGPLVIEPLPVWQDLLADLVRGTAPGVISARFHRGLADAILATADRIIGDGPIDTVALTGGCFQNATLFALVHGGLVARGRRVLSHADIPANDGGLALGQALVALARFQADTAQAAGRGTVQPAPERSGISQSAPIARMQDRPSG